jgi:hypothetical protein
MATSSSGAPGPTDSAKKRAARSGWYFAAVAAFDVLALAVTVPINLALGVDAIEALGIAVVGVATFIALLYHALEVRRSTDGVRDAIAGAFVLVYLLLVIFATFFVSGGGQPNPETVTLLNSFTTIAAVVLGFYFTTGTVDKYLSQRRPKKSKQNWATVHRDARDVGPDSDE